MKNIHIITITDGNINSLKLTLKSIDNQDYNKFRNLIISKTKIKNFNKIFKSTNRSFFYQKNYW